MHEDKSYIKKAFKLGASGYVTKSTAHEEILQAIDKGNGEKWNLFKWKIRNNFLWII